MGPFAVPQVLQGPSPWPGKTQKGPPSAQNIAPFRDFPGTNILATPSAVSTMEAPLLTPNVAPRDPRRSTFSAPCDFTLADRFFVNFLFDRKTDQRRSTTSSGLFGKVLLVSNSLDGISLAGTRTAIVPDAPAIEVNTTFHRQLRFPRQVYLGGAIDGIGIAVQIEAIGKTNL
jgi:hypothetical protein